MNRATEEKLNKYVKVFGKKAVYDFLEPYIYYSHLPNDVIIRKCIEHFEKRMRVNKDE